MFRYLLALLVSLTSTAALAADPLPWLRDDRAAFERARDEQRFVLLYLEAVWCHWCHVMDHETYADAGVRQAIGDHYVPLRIDSDARPDLADRYRDYGWPATIVFAPDGSEIVKRQGYIRPEAMRRLLAAIVADPSAEHPPPPEPPAMTGSELGADTRAMLQQRHIDTHDDALGGLRSAIKYLERDSVEYALVRGAGGDTDERARAMQTLDAARALIDPAWGGVYQYSTHGDWQHPHFEKLALRQGDYLRIYALAYGFTREPRYRDAAEAIRRYIDGFLQAPDGGWYTSQDADLVSGQHSADYFALDDSRRRALGHPRIDRNRYAAEAGTIIEALALWYEVSGDQTALASAEAGARWVLSERRRSDGSFAHADDVAGPPYLSDNLAMARALLQLYRVTAERHWLADASRTADLIDARFRATRGYASATTGSGPIAPAVTIDTNIALARFANALSHYTGSDLHRDMASHAFAWLAEPAVALSRITEAGILLADIERSSDPLHLTVVGARNDPAARALFDACLRVPGAYKRVEWWDRDEGPLPNPDIRYPPSARAAAYVCTDRRCSTPIRAPDQIAQFLAERQ